MRAHRSVRTPRPIEAAILALALALGATPAAAAPDWLSLPEIEWEDSRAQEVAARSVDALIVRPLATLRVVAGALLFLPAAVLSSPMGREGFDSAYDVLIDEPIEYAFERPLGDL